MIFGFCQYLQNTFITSTLSKILFYSRSERLLPLLIHLRHSQTRSMTNAYHKDNDDDEEDDDKEENGHQVQNIAQVFMLV